MYCIGKEKFDNESCGTWIDSCTVIVVSVTGECMVLRLESDSVIASRTKVEMEPSCLDSKISDLELEEYKLVIGGFGGYVKIYSLTRYDQTFKLKLSTSIKKPFNKELTEIKWLKENNFFVSLVGGNQINLHKSSCSVIRTIKNMDFMIKKLICCESNLLYHVKASSIVKINFKSAQVITKIWRAHEHDIVDLAKRDSYIYSLGSDLRIKAWNVNGTRIWQSAKMTTYFTSICFSNTDIYLVSDISIFRTKIFTFSMKEVPIHSDVSTVGRRVIGSTSEIGAIGMFSNNYIFILMPFLEPIVRSSQVFLMNEPNIIRIQRSGVVDGFELLDTGSNIVKMMYEFQKLVVLTLSLEVRVYDTDNLKLLSTVQTSFITHELILSKETFLVDKNVYDYFGMLEIELDDDFLSAKLRALNPEYVVWYVERSIQEKEFVVTCLNHKIIRKYDMKHVLRELEISQVNNTVAFLNQMGTIGIFEISEDIFELNVRYLGHSCAFMSICYHETCDILCGIPESKDKLVLFPCPRTYLCVLRFIGYELKQEITLPKNGCFTLQAFQGCEAYIQNTKNGNVEVIKSKPGIERLLKLVQENTTESWVKGELTCQTSKSKCLWAILASQALVSGRIRELRVALSELDSILYANYLGKYCSGKQYRSKGYFYLLKGDFPVAERIYLNSKPSLTLDAIMVNIKLGNFIRALEQSTSQEKIKQLIKIYEKEWISGNPSLELRKNIKALKEAIFPREHVFDRQDQSYSDEEKAY